MSLQIYMKLTRCKVDDGIEHSFEIFWMNKEKTD